MRIACSSNVTTGAKTASSPVIPTPPRTFDHRKQLQASTVALISQRWPALSDLAADGTLVAVPRPADYIERREDGYREPELVLLIGTAHLSPQSAADVARVVAAVRPQNVVVELCSSRSSQLYDQSSVTGANGNESGSNAAANPMSLSGGSLLESFQRTMRLGGRSALLLRLLLGNLSKELSLELGVGAGSEFAAAREAAEAVGAQVVLGDRPIEVTLRRAWQALPQASRWRLASDLMQGASGVRGLGSEGAAAALERLRDDDVVSWMLGTLAEQYPEALGPLVHERDLYLAWSLKRSKAVNGTSTVVGVLGRGHLRGVCYALTADSGELRFRDLAGSRKKGQGGATIAAAQLVAETAAFFLFLDYWNRHHPY